MSKTGGGPGSNQNDGRDWDALLSQYPHYGGADFLALLHV